MTNSALARLCAFVVASSFAVACAPDGVDGSGVPSSTSTKTNSGASTTPPSSSAASSDTESGGEATTAGNVGTTTTNAAPPRNPNTGTATQTAANTNTGTATQTTTPAPATVACNTDADSITASYKIALLRAPDTAGFQYWQTQLQADTQTRINVLENMVRSKEFADLHQGLNDTQYVTSLYKGLLGRAPEQAGLDYWLGQLANGLSRADAAQGFVDSPEFADPTENAAFACYF